MKLSLNAIGISTFELWNRENCKTAAMFRSDEYLNTKLTAYLCMTAKAMWQAASNKSWHNLLFHFPKY